MFILSKKIEDPIEIKIQTNEARTMDTTWESSPNSIISRVLFRIVLWSQKLGNYILLILDIPSFKELKQFFPTKRLFQSNFFSESSGYAHTRCVSTKKCMRATTTYIFAHVLSRYKGSWYHFFKIRLKFIDIFQLINWR